MNHRPTLTVLTLIGTLLGASLAANAQEQGATPHRGGLMARAMAGITLTPSEQSQIDAAKMKYKASRKTSTPETRRDFVADVEAALTPAQRTQFEDNMRTLRARMKAERNAAAPAPQAS